MPVSTMVRSMPWPLWPVGLNGSDSLMSCTVHGKPAICLVCAVFVSVAFMVPMPTFCSSSAMDSSGVTVAVFLLRVESTKRRPSMSMIRDWVLPPIRLSLR